jgi:transcriptional regulator with XRE-family HTH domain
MRIVTLARMAQISCDRVLSQMETKVNPGHILTEKSGIRIDHISKLENGHRQACLEKMALISEALGMKLSELLKGID